MSVNKIFCTYSLFVNFRDLMLYHIQLQDLFSCKKVCSFFDSSLIYNSANKVIKIKDFVQKLINQQNFIIDRRV